MKKFSTWVNNIIPKSLIKYRLFIFAPFILLILLAISALTYKLIYWGKIYPGISVAGVDVGGLTPDIAADKLSEEVPKPINITLASDEQQFEIPIESIGFSYDYEKSSSTAYYLYRTGNIFYDLYKSVNLYLNPVNLGLRIQLNEEKLTETLSVITGQVIIDPVYPTVKYSSGKVIVEKGKEGVDVDLNKLRIIVGQSLAYANNNPISIPKYTIDPTLSDEEAEAFGLRAEYFIQKDITIKFEYTNFIYEELDIFKLLKPIGGYNDSQISILSQEVAQKVDRDPQNAIFEFTYGKVQEFLPAETGIAVMQAKLSEMLTDALIELETTETKSVHISLPYNETSPRITTEEVNNLGIKELIGRGTSRFSGSISSRIHNISLASSKFNGILVAPNETFSFNDVLGDISIFTGYKQAYIIKDGKTVLGDGGGVCQVSTTLFRAILASGLPVSERRAHSYRVSYYEQGSPPGIDATIYAPTTDLKFKNDTPGHILIQTWVDTYNASLVFEFYGTSDGRISTISKPVVTDVVPPPEDLYQDDPSLPSGTVKQIDWKAWGAKVWFDYEVEKDGEIIYTKRFYSNFRPWQAIYLRGTGPAN